MNCKIESVLFFHVGTYYAHIILLQCGNAQYLRSWHSRYIESFQEKNVRDNVTGILVYQKSNREFFQILEGETQVIFDLLKTIEFDKRNTSQHLVYDSEINERNFKGWSMAFSDLDSVTSDKLDGFSEYLDKGFTSELVQEKTANASKMIKMFQFYLNDGTPN